jgi:hypothetical protein
MTLTPGTLVLLVDGRGCHREHRLTVKDAITPERVTIAGQIWRTMPFTVTARSTLAGLPVLRARKAAIGHVKEAYSPLHLPDGWSSPLALWARHGVAS